MDLKQYIDELNRQFKTGLAREHSYRPALKDLLQSLLPNMVVTNEPAHFECGAPDYIISREKDHLPVFFVEAKDVGDNDLDGRNAKGHKEQFDRYKQALDYILFTDYLDFHLYEHGEFVDSVRIAEVKGDKIVAIREAENKFLSMIQHLSGSAIQGITSASKLAKLMAGKARLLENIVEQALQDESYSEANDNLQGQYEAFRDYLIQDLKKSDFADIYAQTIAYGMFAARLHDPTPETFSREEAARLIPKTNPFLRNLFNNVAGNELDDRIAWVVDDLVTVFQAADLKTIMGTYGKDKRHHDPMIHFYEDFLSEYNPKLRKSKGVWYTPQPVVGFIVRAVDEILQKDFGLTEGLADYSMIEKDFAVEQSRDKRTADGMKHEKRKIHRVQILDPATGTGTFLAEVVNQIYDRYRDQQGIWQQYVEQHLLPRLNGFEILMASYAVAHLKLDMLLGETGYQHQTDKRLHVYLTNSLEESNNEPRNLFAQWLSREATEANVIKRDCPVMVMIGNPPYSGESQNGKLGVHLIEKFKLNPGTSKNIPDTKWLNSDEVKFLGLAMSCINRNEIGGIIGFINPHTYLDGQTFRGLRWQLLNTFDKIYIVNLHGNTTSGETKNSNDENVFDIRQGVCINIFVKNNKKEKGKLAEVRYSSLYGMTREAKSDALNSNTINSIDFEVLDPKAPYYFFVPKNFSEEKKYNKGFAINHLFIKSGVGICSKRDKIAFHDNKEKLIKVLNDFKTLPENEIKEKYEVTSESRDQKVAFAKANVQKYGISEDMIQPILYRPFDMKWTYFTDMSKGFIAFPVYDLMKHLAKGRNVALIANSSIKDGQMTRYFVSNSITDLHVLETANANAKIFPLFIYKDNFGVEERIPNLNPEIVERIAAIVGDVSERRNSQTSQRLEALATMPSFVDMKQHIQIRRDVLPHWHQPDKTQFVTFRLADSMPQEKLLELQEYKEKWMKEHPMPWDEKTSKEYEREIRNKTEKWLDEGYGSCILKRPDIRKIVYDALLFFQGVRYYIHHFVIMPNHVHLLITPIGEHVVNNDLGSVKRFTANAINKVLGTKGEVWQRLVFDHMVRNEAYYDAFVSYINNNPEHLPPDTFTLFDSVGNASERCNDGEFSQRLEALATIEPLDLFDYIYAVLHSPSYRERYKEFLKIDFPRIPYPTNGDKFRELAEKGAELRKLHLMEDLPAKTGVTFPMAGSMQVDCNRWQDNRVYINSEQYFEGVPESAWNFYIGGYQPAQKWLKDRKGQTLSFEDVKHYGRIIYVLLQTERLMGEIDKIMKESKDA